MSTTASVLQSLAAALADGSVRVVDLSQPLHEKTPVLKLPPCPSGSKLMGRNPVAAHSPKIGVRSPSDRASSG